jgi:hypothetical protein
VFRKHNRKGVGAMLISAALMVFSVILHPREQTIEAVRDETRRKKDAQSGDPEKPAGGRD